MQFGAIAIAILVVALVVGGHYLFGLYHPSRQPPSESGNQSTPVGSCGGSSDWKLVWGDEFNGTGLPNSADWDFLNGEAVGVKTVYYTNRLQNITQHDGSLLITLIRENHEGKPYTSGGIVNNESKHAIVYGRFEARMKFSKGHITWPAFWVVAHDKREIDIMEYNANWGPLEGFTSSIHLDYGDNYNTAHIEIPISDMDTTYHLYVLEWYPDRMDFYVDDYKYWSVSTADVPDVAKFDRPMYAILNIEEDDTKLLHSGNDVMPAYLYVDYFHICQK